MRGCFPHDGIDLCPEKVSFCVPYTHHLLVATEVAEGNVEGKERGRKEETPLWG